MNKILNKTEKDRLNLVWLILLFFTVALPVKAQNSLNDCSGAIEVCGNGAISSNASGVGQQEITDNACSSMEHNSLWIKIEITRAGTLGFTLTPTSANLEIDYDFFVFGPNVSCGNLGEAIRCSTTNPLASGQADNLTGMNDQSVDTSEGPGPSGNSFVKSLDVLPGESYFIVIDRPIGQSPFDLEWTGTSTINGSPFPEGVEVNKPNDLVKCGINGMAEFDLSSTANEITSQPQTAIEYYAQLAHAIDRINELQLLYSTSTNNQTIYARVENLITGCSEIVDFSLLINPGPEISTLITAEVCDLDLNGVGTFNFAGLQQEILQDLNPEDHIISFYRSVQDAINNTGEVASSENFGEETLFARVEEINGSECFSIATVDLLLTEPEDISGLSRETLNLKIGSGSIEIPVKSGLEYAVNDPNGPYSPGPKIKDIPAGMNTLYIRNTARCELFSLEVLVPEFPAAFSPNNDGFYDNWFVSTGSFPVADRPVRIFDRYGKLLGRFFVNNGNWDGTFNGSELPADDYWFEFSLPENVIVKGHFSLVR